MTKKKKAPEFTAEEVNKLRCPTCYWEGTKALYAGIPIKLCTNEECSTVWGFWSFLITLLPFNGWFFAYEGNYFIALWDWLFGREE
ncbi:MAG TPA: hypothetical protein ENH31_00485 [Nitrospirae bacterium]|nr:hypothetical protein [Nitrospirota bacterium]HDK81029.1 hypothetical protein [Nitrospirota bacterium]